MKKLICLLGILLMLTLLVPAKPAEAFRGHGGHGWFLPGLIVGSVLGWGLAPRYYYPPAYYYPPPAYDYPPPVYSYPPPGEVSPAPPSGGQVTGGQIFIYPRQGQSDQQLSTDRNECHNWAMDKTGYDPTKPPPAERPTAQIARQSSDYQRALDACLDGRGYTMR